MAQRVVVELVDDLDGSEAIETIRFALDSVSYEIDLNAGNAIELRDFLERFRTAGRRAGGHVAKQPAVTGADTRSIRRWALDNSVPVNLRGRIKADVVRRWALDNSVPVNPRGRIKTDVVRQFEAANA